MPVRARFPAIMAEIEGLAEGLELPVDAVFAWNCRGDISAMAPDGCTTVQVPGPRIVVAHNEDGDPGFRGACGRLRARPNQGLGFTAFVYPGSIPGHTFAATEAGLVPDGSFVDFSRPLGMSSKGPRWGATQRAQSGNGEHRRADGRPCLPPQHVAHL